MKKILLFIIFATFLASCGNNNSENVIEEAPVVKTELTTVTATGMTEQARTDLEELLQKFEATLRAEGFEESVIKQAIEVKKAELTAKIIGE